MNLKSDRVVGIYANSLSILLTLQPGISTIHTPPTNSRRRRRRRRSVERAVVNRKSGAEHALRRCYQNLPLNVRVGAFATGC